MAELTYKRILIKLSGEAFGGADGQVYDVERLANFAKKVMTLQARGHEVAVVCGAGNIWRARDMEHLALTRPKSDNLGMMAVSMNASVFAETILGMGGVSQAYAPSHVQISEHTYTYRTDEVEAYMEFGGIPILGGGTGHPYATTDLAAVLRGLELSCDIVIKCSTVDGVYDKDPNKYDDAVKYETLSIKDAVTQGLQVMDQAALGLARQEGITVTVGHMDQLDQFGTDGWTGTMVE